MMIIKKNEIISFILIPILFVTFIDAFYYISNFNTLYFAMPKSMIMSTLIIYLIYLVFIGITRKTKKAIIILSIIIAIFVIINQIKIFYMDEPISFSDLMYLNDSKEIIGIIKSTLMDTLLKHGIHILVVICFMALIIFLGIKSNINVIKSKIRITSICLPIIILVILFLPIGYVKNFMMKNVFDTDERKDYNRNCTNVESIFNYGVIAGMYEQLLECRISEPKNYNENELESILCEASDKEDVNKSQDSPNIILLFSESFWDIDQQDEIKFDKAVTSNFNKLKSEGKFVNIISPSYGGVSTNIEFELLTGANVAHFNKGYIPYMQLYKNDTYYTRESIIKNLKDNGYKTKVLTANSEKLYNCGNVYNYMGIDETEYLDSITDPSAIKGYYISDEYITNKIIDDFNNKENGQKIFYMAQTMQAHMPYALEKYENYDIKITQSDLNNDMNEVMLSYAQGIFDADKQLGRLYEYIQTLNENTIIVFLGDHLPFLKTKNKEQVINYLNYFNTEDDILNLYRLYNTQALILANYDISSFDDANYLGDDLILTYVINNIGIDISDYYKWLYTTRAVLPTYNHYVAMDSFGNIYDINNITDEMKKTYELREKMQYKFLVK